MEKVEEQENTVDGRVRRADGIYEPVKHLYRWHHIPKR